MCLKVYRDASRHLLILIQPGLRQRIDNASALRALRHQCLKGESLIPEHKTCTSVPGQPLVKSGREGQHGSAPVFQSPLSTLNTDPHRRRLPNLSTTKNRQCGQNLPSQCM